MDNQPPKLLLDGNQLSGTMPYLGSLTQFDVSRNPNLEGTLFPLEYSSWVPPSNQVVRIDISDTQMTGSLETIFCNRFLTLGQSEAKIVVDCTLIQCSCCICVEDNVMPDDDPN